MFFFCIWGFLSLVALFFEQVHPFPPHVEFLFCCLKVVQILVLAYLKLPQLHIESLVLVPHVLATWVMSQVPVADVDVIELVQRYYVHIWISLSLLVTQVRPAPLCLTLLADQAVRVVYGLPWEPKLEELNCLAIWCTIAAFILISAWSDQRNLWSLYEAQQQLVKSKMECELEKEATEALLSMHCDAGLCWVGADGATVIHSSAALDAVLRAPMCGRELAAAMPEAEAARFRSATRGVSEGAKRAPVRLLPTTLLRASATPVPVDLWIVDRRTEFAQRAGPAGADAPGDSGARRGFLVGVRLVPGVEENPLAQGAPWAPFPRVETAGAGDSSPSGAGASDGDAAGGDESSGEGADEVQLARPRSGRQRTASSLAGPSCASVASAATLLPRVLPAPRLHTCSRQALEAGLLGDPPSLQLARVECQQTRETVLAALDLVCKHAAGGALVCVAEGAAFDRTFQTRAAGSQSTAPTIQLCDDGYMNRKLQGLPIVDPRFAEAFREFTRHTADDRWPPDAADAGCRGRPKDGAFLIDVRGQRKACAAKLLGLQPAVSWPDRGTRHEAAAACAWAVPGSVAVVRSDRGSVCVVMRQGGQIHAYEVADECPV